MEETTCCVDENCKINLTGNEHEVVNDQVRQCIEDKLDAFSDAIERSDTLEIDAYIEGTTYEEDVLKVLNHTLHYTYGVSIKTIIKTPLEQLLKALYTGEFITQYGVTRIVGYYSRIHNWNKSKIGELRDRHQGNYGVEKS